MFTITDSALSSFNDRFVKLKKYDNNFGLFFNIRKLLIISVN